MDKKLKIKKHHKFHAYWSKKENDLIVFHPLGRQTSADVSFLFNNVFTREFMKEMTRRGYDLSTLKFEICPKLPNEKRFPSLTKLYYPENKII